MIIGLRPIRASGPHQRCRGRARPCPERAKRDDDHTTDKAFLRLVWDWDDHRPSADPGRDKPCPYSLLDVRSPAWAALSECFAGRYWTESGRLIDRYRASAH